MNRSATSVVHLISGDRWAGAEVQAFTLLEELQSVTDFSVRVICLNEGRLVSELLHIGVPVLVLDESKMNSLEILGGLRRSFTSDPPGVLHTHRYKENVLGSLACRSMPSCRRVKTVHGASEIFSGWNRWKMYLYDRLDRAVTAHYCDAIICVSREIQAHMQARYPSIRSVCVHNGINLRRCIQKRARQEVRTELRVSPEASIILAAGRLVPVKGLDVLLEAVAALRSSMPELTVWIAGDGPERVRLEALTSDLHLGTVVQFLGHRSDVVDLMGAADLFVLPSLSEGIPMVVLEAMCAGIPIVASAVGGLPEILSHERTAHLVEAGQPRALAQACLRVLTDAGYSQRLIQSARQEVTTTLSADHMASGVVNVYREFCG